VTSPVASAASGGPKFFSQFFYGLQLSKSMSLTCFGVLSQLLVLTLPRLYLVSLEASFSVVDLRCCSSFLKCNSSDLLFFKIFIQLLNCPWMIFCEMAVKLPARNAFMACMMT
jgi:hypothetical protein